MQAQSGISNFQAQVQRRDARLQGNSQNNTMSNSLGYDNVQPQVNVAAVSAREQSGNNDVRCKDIGADWEHEFPHMTWFRFILVVFIAIKGKS